MSVCWSGLRDLEAYSLLGGGVPIPEQRLRRYLDSVPIFSLLCFMSTMVLFPPHLPSKIHPGSCPQCILPLASLLSSHCLLSVHFCVVGRPPPAALSPVIRPSEVYNPPADCRQNALLLVSCSASRMKVCIPSLTCAANVTWLGCGWRGEGDGAPCDGLEFLNVSTGVAQDSVPSSTL